MKKAYAALGIVYVVWGSTYLAIKYTVQTIPPFVGSGGRFVVVGALMLLVTLAVRGRRGLRMTRSELLHAALVGVLLTATGNALVAVGEQRVPSGLAALTVACVPLWIVLIRAVLGDRPTPVTVVGVLVGLGGVAALFLPGGSGGGVDVAYALVAVLGSLSWAIGSVIAVRRPMPKDALALTTVESFAGGAFSLLLATVTGEWGRFHPGAVSGQSWLALAYLITFGSMLAFTAYAYSLGNLPVSLVSTYAFVNPVIAVLLGVVVANESLAWSGVLGAGLIVAAVAVVVVEEGRRNRRTKALARAAAVAPEPMAA